MLGQDFITVVKVCKKLSIFQLSYFVKVDDLDWPILKPTLFATIMDFFNSNQPVVLHSPSVESVEPPTHESEIVAMIKELLDERIR